MLPMYGNTTNGNVLTDRDSPHQLHTTMLGHMRQKRLLQNVSTDLGANFWCGGKDTIKMRILGNLPAILRTRIRQ